MRSVFVLLVLAFLLAACAPVSDDPVLPGENETIDPQDNESFSLVLPFEGEIPEEYTCDGANLQPEVGFANVPEDAQTVALIMDDPDAPGGTFDHWTVWNIPAGSNLSEGEPPIGATEGLNGARETGYIGPCPPDGEHRYVFSAYALDTALDLPPGSTKQALEDAIEGHIIAEDTAVATYG